jgi:predicted small metal-binding protein
MPLPSITCKDVGMDCPFEAEGTTNHELMRKFTDHAESAHKMQVLPADIIFKVQKAIRK